MSDRITKLQRWLDLIAFLVGRRVAVPLDAVMNGVPAYAAKWDDGDELARAAVRRMFERDKDELRDAGIPLESVASGGECGAAEQFEGYRLAARDFYLPYLKLVGREAAAGGGAGAGGSLIRDRIGGPAGMESVEVPAEHVDLALAALCRAADLPGFPLAAEARTALRKLSFDVGPAAVRPPPVLHAAPAGAAGVAEAVRLLSRALLARKRVGFRYRGMARGADTQRDVAPYGLLLRQGHWYLVGDDALRCAIRVFRADRMADVRGNARAPHSPDYEIPADFRLATYAQREAWDLAGGAPVRVEVRFAFPASLWAERNRKGELLRQQDGGAAVRAFGVRHVPAFLRWLLSFKGEARVLAPPALDRELTGLALRVARLHAGEADGVAVGEAACGTALGGGAGPASDAGGGEAHASAGRAAERASTADRLARLLCLIPLAARQGEVGLRELAEALGVGVDDVVADLEELAARELYHPPGPADQVQVLVEHERVSVFTTGQFRRPPRLSQREALALGLGLRALALELPVPRRATVLDLARALERRLAVEPPDALLERYALAEDDAAGAEIRALLSDAVAGRIRCRLSYLKAGAASPEERTVRPYAVATAEGGWYVIGFDEDRCAVRVFRLDRILEARSTGEQFDAPAGFDPADYVRDGRAYFATEETEVTVRYSPQIARWIAERHDVETCADGSVLVRHRVADPDWIVRGVLYYAGAAEVVAPAWVRQAIAAHQTPSSAAI